MKFVQFLIILLLLEVIFRSILRLSYRLNYTVWIVQLILGTKINFDTVKFFQNSIFRVGFSVKLFSAKFPVFIGYNRTLKIWTIWYKRYVNSRSYLMFSSEFITGLKDEYEVWIQRDTYWTTRKLEVLFEGWCFIWGIVIFLKHLLSSMHFNIRLFFFVKSLLLDGIFI